LARRIAHAENAPLPGEKKAVEIRKELISRGDLEPVKGIDGVYIVTAPYANLLEVSEEQLVQEANPWAVFGFLTAMVHHGLTDLLPGQVYAIHFKDGKHLRRMPLGTTPEDWAELGFPATRQPRKLSDTAIVWTEIQGQWEFGFEVGYSSGLPIYVTDVERTLLDALRMPEKCGGIAKVLRAWRSAGGMDVDRLVQYTDRFGIQNLRQRVGFMLESLGRSHPALEGWRHGLQRGGSVKLVASEPYAETYSADWNLSLNVPPSVLAIIEED
jgi:predicted transcriptional regulator of viral defense system